MHYMGVLCCIPYIHHLIESLQICEVNGLYFPSVQSLSRVQLFATPWTASSQASLSITNSWSLFKLMSIELVMSSNYFPYPLPISNKEKEIEAQTG